MSSSGLPVDARPDSAASRLPKHNRANLENDALTAATDRLEIDRQAGTTRLATKPEIELREEATYQKDGEPRAKSWAAVTTEWRQWLRDVKDTSAVFEGYNVATGEEDEQVIPLENRFMEARQKRLYAKLHDLERGMREAYGEDLTTSMLTFTASNRSAAGDWWRCPGNHLDDLMGSWPAVRRALHRALEGREWEYARILEPHESGFVHVHIAVFVRGTVHERTFAPAMDAHVRHCLPAGSEAHDPAGDSVSIENDVSNVAAYLSAYVMKYGEEALEAPEHVQRFNALLWATNTRRWSVSNGAQEYMAFDGPEKATDWEYDLTHIEIGAERYPIEQGGGEVLMVSLGQGGAGLDPPPDRS